MTTDVVDDTKPISVYTITLAEFDRLSEAEIHALFLGMGFPQYLETMTAAEVSKLFRVEAQAVTRWALQDRILSFKTMGNQHRFPRHGVERSLIRSMIMERELTEKRAVARAEADELGSVLADHGRTDGEPE